MNSNAACGGRRQRTALISATVCRFDPARLRAETFLRSPFVPSERTP